MHIFTFACTHGADVTMLFQLGIIISSIPAGYVCSRDLYHWTIADVISALEQLS